MNQEAKVIIGIGITTLVLLFGAVFFLSGNKTSESVDESILIKSHNHKIATDSPKITLVEFADFQCPACAAAHPIVQQILDDHKENITYVYRHFPLSMHKNAELASIASETAGEQDAFWQMNDMLFENQKEWSESNDPSELFIRYADELGLDSNKFANDLSSNKYNNQINQDRSDGLKLGVSGTPTFFLNDKKLNLRSVSELPAVIEEELKS